MGGGRGRGEREGEGEGGATQEKGGGSRKIRKIV